MSEYKLPNQKESRRRRAEQAEIQYTEESGLNGLGTGRTYYMHTYGCQANVRDGETLAGMLGSMGFRETSEQTEADVLIFNTCAVRKAAEEHVLGEIGTLKPLKKAHPEKIFVLCGCMAQEEAAVKELIERYPQVDLIFGTHNLHRFPQLLQKAMQGQRVVEVESVEGAVVEGMPAVRSRKHKAFVNIMYGCDKFCTYCIVPYTRGKERSRRPGYILKEIRELKENGCKEVTLLGQNVNAYGKDLGMEDGFTSLLRDCAATGIDRIRFYSSHPRDYTVSTIEAMRDCPNIMKALHLPVQSGSTEVLRRMNRGYTADQYKQLFDDMKARIPEITFTTDLIVGFPGETDQQFQETLDLVDYCRFDLAYSFAYSPREGTPAATYPDSIPEEIKKERLNILNERLAKYARQNNEAYVGRTLEVLCDGPSKKNPDTLAGYSRENKLVNFTAKDCREGDLVNVRITDAKSFSLDGEAVKKEVK